MKIKDKKEARLIKPPYLVHMYKKGSWAEYQKTGKEPETFCGRSLWKTKHHAYGTCGWTVTCKECLKEMAIHSQEKQK